MYFKLPMAILFSFVCLAGLFWFQGGFEQPRPAQRPVPAVAANNEKVGYDDAISTIRERDLRAHLEFLADDMLEGRDTGTRGGRIAANYIRAHFEKIGLKPGGEGGTFTQSVPLVAKRLHTESELRIEVDGEMIPLRYGEDFLVVDTPAQSGVLFERPLVFAGFGITAPEYNYDDYAGLDVAEKFVVYVSGEPASDDPDYFLGQRSSRHAGGGPKRSAARSKGASGVLGIVREEQLMRFDWSSLQNFLMTGTVTLKTAAAASENDIPALILHPKAAELVFAGSQKSYDEIDQAATVGEVKPFVMQKRANIRVNFEETEIKTDNVLGFLEGSDEKLKSEIIVLTAHYDHVGIGTPVQGDSVYNGAADNASGVSGLLALAEAFAQLPIAPRRSLLFLATTAEEKGLLGSRYYTEHPVFPMENTVANINLDMIGLIDTTGLVVYGIERSSLGEEMRRAAEKIGLTILPDDLPEQRVFYRSDHYNFALKGVPAIFPSFGISKAQQGIFNSFYHRPNDDATLKWINYRYMKKHVQTIFLAAISIANADEPPAWHAGDEFEKVRMQQK